MVKASESISPEYEIFIDGSKILPEIHIQIEGVMVDQDVESVDMFSILINAGEVDVESDNWIDSNIFNPGSEVKIRVDYDDAFETLIIGEITSLSPDFHGSPLAITLKVEGYDRLYRLGFGRKTKSFLNTKDSEIAVQIAQNWKLTPQVDTTDIVYNYILQNNQTDREFLMERARSIRYEVRVEDKTLYFQKPRENQDKIITLTYDEDLIDFSPRMSIVHQTSKVAVRGWNPKDKKTLIGEAGIGDETTKMGGKKTGVETAQLVSGKTEWCQCKEAVVTKEAAEVRARAQFNKMALDFVTGEGSCTGNPGIKAGEVIELKGLGKRFSGLYYIVSSRHVIRKEEGYTTYFKVKRNSI